MFCTLSKQYFVMYPLRQIDLSKLSVSDLTEQKELLLATVQHPLSQCYPPSVTYRKHFLKLLISRLEECCDEVLDDLYTEYTDLLSKEDSEFCFRTYFLPDDTPITLQESTHLISDGTTGLCTWQAAQYLAEWLLEESDLFTDKFVLELGSGLGLTGITLYQHCHPSHFIFSDCHAKVLSLLKENIVRNSSMSAFCNTDSTSASLPIVSSAAHETGPECQTQKQVSGETGDNSSQMKCLLVNQYALADWSERTIDNVSIFTNALCKSAEVWQLDWETVSESTIWHLSRNVEIILAADVVYDENVIPALVRIIRNILHGGSNRRAYVASTIRNVQTRHKFIEALEAASVLWQVVPAPNTQVFYFDRSIPIEIIKLHLKTGDVVK